MNKNFSTHMMLNILLTLFLFSIMIYFIRRTPSNFQFDTSTDNFDIWREQNVDHVVDENFNYFRNIAKDRPYDGWLVDIWRDCVPNINDTCRFTKQTRQVRCFHQGQETDQWDFCTSLFGPIPAQKINKV